MKTNPIVSLQTVTPEMAAEWLKRNEGNRKLSDKNVFFIYKQMLEGQWQVTADTIKIGTDGRLLDGQNRLHAVIKYGKPVQMFVAEGLSNEIFTVLDTGKNRSAGDVLQIKGYKYVNNLSGTVRAILLWEAGHYNTTGTDRRNKPSNMNILNFVENNEAIHEVITYTYTVYSQFRYLPQSQLGMLYWILSKKNQTKADVFFEKYANGADLGVTSPIRMLRERFLKDSTNRTKLNLRDKTALFLMAWNHYIKGTRITNLMLAKNYSFPKPV